MKNKSGITFGLFSGVFWGLGLTISAYIFSLYNVSPFVVAFVHDFISIFILAAILLIKYKKIDFKIFTNIKNISVTIAKAIKDKEDFNAEINGKAKKKERVKLRKISINSKSNIESEEQVNEYISAIEKDIEKLKNEMLEAIKNNKIVDIG